MSNKRISLRSKMLRLSLIFMILSLSLLALTGIVAMVCIKKGLVSLSVIVLLYAALFVCIVLGNMVGLWIRTLIYSNEITHLKSDAEMISRGVLVHRADVPGDDEIGELAENINVMAQSLQTYMDIITEKERIDTEIEVAMRIQADMLPVVEDMFPRGHKDFALYADMEPAKEVGGDFYDFFLLDSNHLALVMADVSGKGVSAAMLMVMAKTLLKSQILSCVVDGEVRNASPAIICTKVNNMLADQIRDDLFVTAWVGILELSTGVLLSTNAGHEYPLLKRAGRLYEIVKSEHCPPLGSLRDIAYTERSATLYFGDRLFLYTDGLPESKNAAIEEFGTERLLGVLNENPIASPSVLINHVRVAVKEFTAGETQYDDITMLSLHYTRK